MVAPQPGMVVIAQSFHTRWRAMIDGIEAPVLRANHAFQAVVVPAGRHSVRLIYADRGFLIGAGVSFATLILCAIAWFRIERGVNIDRE